MHCNSKSQFDNDKCAIKDQSSSKFNDSHKNMPLNLTTSLYITLAMSIIPSIFLQGIPEEELLRQQQELFAKARAAAAEQEMLQQQQLQLQYQQQLQQQQQQQLQQQQQHDPETDQAP
jgi:hypothetical protein